MQEQLPRDSTVERTGMYSQGESRSKRGSPEREGALGCSVFRKLMSANFRTH